MEKMITVPLRHAFRMMNEGPGGAVSCLFRLCRMKCLRGILHNRNGKKVGTEHSLTIGREDKISNIGKLSD